ncbi:hypothetical protein SDC9_198437 [bioreactor metagenome]|uniref:Reverse transcriptase domain-containing protein n=1 Tax=bioreactor metagenome TaxID=1076179 RepID=A0A645IHM2_9ZZZZ
MGYKKLLAFELANLCTTIDIPKKYLKYLPKRILPQNSPPYAINHDMLGVLAQGAPTSPMLSNLIAKKLDDDLYCWAQKNGFVYTRYADDLIFSTTLLPSSKSISALRNEIVYLIKKNNFIENKKKFHVAGPGSRKRVLGLLVDGNSPRISKKCFVKLNSIYIR